VSLGEQSVESELRLHEQPGLRLLVADDDKTVLSLYVNLLGDVPGISSVVDASDGYDAVLIAHRLHCDIAVLDFNMPRVNGLDSALVLRRDFPSLRVAIQSADPYALEERAAGLGLTLFDKLDLDRLLAWIERQAAELNGVGSRTVAALAPRIGHRSLA
jgi:DNA-binding NarL/FixJ family response regulator